MWFQFALIFPYPQVALVVKNLSANAGEVRDTGSVPESGRSPTEGNGKPLQYSCLENPTDGGAWRFTVHAVKKVRHDWRDLAYTLISDVECWAPFHDLLLFACLLPRNICSHSLHIFTPDCLLFSFWVPYILLYIPVLRPYQIYDFQIFSPIR